MEISPEEKFIKGVQEAIDLWYNGCPKSLIFVNKIIKLMKEYKELKQCQLKLG